LNKHISKKTGEKVTFDLILRIMNCG